MKLTDSETTLVLEALEFWEDSSRQQVATMQEPEHQNKLRNSITESEHLRRVIAYEHEFGLTVYIDDTNVETDNRDTSETLLTYSDDPKTVYSVSLGFCLQLIKNALENKPGGMTGHQEQLINDLGNELDRETEAEARRESGDKQEGS